MAFASHVDAAGPHEEELIGLRGLGEQIDLLEVEEVYLPLARLIHLQVAARQRLFAATAEFLGEPQQNPDRPVPFIIGVAGSVAVGKSTTARVLQALLARWDHHPRVDLVTTDGFLYSNAELDRRNLMHRKGFPESYNRRALMRFVTSVKSGSDYACAPVYSHLKYDVIPGAKHVVRHPDILILEGLNVLQTGPTLMVSDLFDFSLYVDARIEDIEQWYVSRFLSLRGTGVRRPGIALPPLLGPQRHEGRRGGARDLAVDQPAQPGREHSAEPSPRHPGAAQGRRPLHQPAAPAQAVAPAKAPGEPGKGRSGGTTANVLRRRPAPAGREATRAAAGAVRGTAVPRNPRCRRQYASVAATPMAVIGTASAATTAARVYTMLATTTPTPARRRFGNAARLNTTRPYSTKKAPRPYSWKDVRPVRDESGSAKKATARPHNPVNVASARMAKRSSESVES